MEICTGCSTWSVCSSVCVARPYSCILAAACVAAAGVETIHPVGSMSDYEKEILTAMKPELIASIEKGIKFVQDN